MRVGEVVEFQVDQVVTRQDHMGGLARLGQWLSAEAAEDARRVQSNTVMNGIEEKLKLLKAQIDDPPWLTSDSTIGGWKTIYNTTKNALDKAKVNRANAIKSDDAFAKWLSPLNAAYSALAEGFSQAKDDGIINALKFTARQTAKTAVAAGKVLVSGGAGAATTKQPEQVKPAEPAKKEEPKKEAAKKEPAKKPAVSSSKQPIVQQKQEEQVVAEQSFMDKAMQYAKDNPAIVAGGGIVLLLGLYAIFSGGSSAPAAAAPEPAPVNGFGMWDMDEKPKRKKRRKSRRKSKK